MRGCDDLPPVKVSAALLETARPTDQHSDVAMQVTPNGKFLCDGFAFGDGTIDHDEPFQRSISVSSPDAVAYEPTAQQSADEAQAVP